MKIFFKAGCHNQQYADALAIRKAVFVDEQQVPLSLEIDEHEADTIHFVGYAAGVPVTTCRLLSVPKGFKVQRVATLKKYRGQKLSLELMSFIEDFARKEGKAYLILGAQEQALGFYQKLGYQISNPKSYLDAGIIHYDMQKNLNLN